MASRTIDGTRDPKYKYQYVVGGTKLYFSSYVTYETLSSAQSANLNSASGNINPSTLKTYLVYEKPELIGKSFVTSAVLQPDGNWRPLKNNEAQYIDLQTSKLGSVVDANSSEYLLGASTRQSLASKDLNSLNTAARQNAAYTVQNAGGLTQSQVNQAYFISQSTSSNARQIPPVLTLNPTPDPVKPTDPGPDNVTSTSTDPQYFESNPIQSSSEDVEYGTLYYPLNRRNTEDYDYLKVTVIKFLETGLRTDAKSFNVISTEKRGVKPLGRVFLPMQPGISDTNGVSWNEDRLNPFQAALGGVAASTIATLGQGKVVAGAKGLFQGLINTGQNIANDPNMQNYVSAYFAGQAVGANLVARTTGAVLNNNLELLFNGPKLRSFRYNFRFTPRDEPESAMIKKIIRMFKREMAASRSDTGLFLITPNVFELEYMTSNNEPHPFLNKIKRCALSDISVNYTPDGTYMTYQDRSMTSYEVQLQFSELEPIYKEDYDDAKGKEGMGY